MPEAQPMALPNLRILLATAAGALAFPAAAGAATFEVNSLDDAAADDVCGAAAGSCTLRDAVDLANDVANASTDFVDNDVVTFSSELSGSITLDPALGPLPVTDPISINGPLDRTITIDGGELTDHIDFLNVPGLSQVGYLDFVDGKETGGGGGSIFAVNTYLDVLGAGFYGNSTEGSYLYGGAISSVGGNLRVFESTFSDNQTTGGTAHGGAISVVDAALTAEDLEFTNNRTTGDLAGGGAIFMLQGVGTLRDATVSGNSTEGVNSSGGAIYVADSNNSFRVIKSTISGNQIEGAGASGGAIAAEAAIIGVENSTISGNSALGTAETGGLHLASSAGLHEIEDSTIAGNYAAGAASTGGIYLDGNDVALSGTAVADNLAGESGSDLASDAPTSVFSLEESLVEEPDAAPTQQSGGTITGLDPDLGPLQDNGGQTETMLPGEGSPLIDGAPSSTAFGDQRNVVRPQGETNDIGAVEVRPAPDVAIDSGPSGTTSDSTPSFSFSSTDGTATFECSIDSGPFSPCASPFETPALGDGQHSFRVRAVGPDRKSDPVEATFLVDTPEPDTSVLDADMTAPKKLKVGGKRVKVKVKGGAGERVSGVAKGKIKVKKGKKKRTVASAKAFKLNKVTKTTEAGEQTVYRLKLRKKKDNKKVLKLLKKGKDLRANPSIKFTDEAGNVATERRVVRLKAR